MPLKKPRPKRTFLYGDHARIIVIFLTIVGMAVGAVAWASSEHLSLKDFAIERDCVIKQELRDRGDQRYVPKENFSRVETRQQNMMERIKGIESKVNDLHDMIIKGN